MLGEWTIWLVLQHPDRPGTAVDFWGGIGSCLGYASIVISIVGSAFMTYKRHQCHVAKCWWPGWHPSDDHGGHVVCIKHHPHGGKVGHAGVNRTAE